MKTLTTSIAALACLFIWTCSKPSEKPPTSDPARVEARVHGTADEQPQGGSAALVLLRHQEPNENAFTFLMPKGWIVQGGIVRVNPLAADGPMNAIAAKLDISVKRDDAGTVMIHWLPDILYFDSRMSPAGQMGLFPPGSNYQGMTVWPILTAQQYLTDHLLPRLHKSATNIRIVEKKTLSALARGYQQRVARFMPGMTFSYDAGMVTISYQEDGVKYKEKLVAVIENWGQLGSGTWGNKETMAFRAPEAEFEKWAPLVSTIQNSVKVNPAWLAGELRGQADRNQIVAKTNADIRRIDREITEHRQKTMAEINNDMFLTLTGQEEYVNPYTKEVERGTNEYKYRWVNAGGETVYSNDSYYDPNHDIDLNRADFRRSGVRPR